jgi:hypothetical protein
MKTTIIEKLNYHLAIDEGRWKVFLHKDRRSIVWSDPKDFKDSCRYLALKGKLGITVTTIIEDKS